MSYYNGSLPSSGGYWGDHEPPNSQTYGRNGTGPQYQTPPDNAQPGQHQNPLLHYSQAHGNMSRGYAENGSHVSASHQASISQPQFINPAQLFSQRPAHSVQPLQPRLQDSDSPRASNLMSEAPRMAAPIQSIDPQPDRSALLMSLAEEFFDAAHELAPSVSISLTSENVRIYERLISTGLACLDAALKHVKLPPRMEAIVRLRYAGVLYEETENFVAAEVSLSKGIALCDRVGCESFRI
jgi:hypothetical protein